MTIEVDLREIKSLLSEVNKKLDVLLEEKEASIKCEPPLKDEIEAIEEYKAAKKKKKLDLVPFEEVAKGI